MLLSPAAGAGSATRRHARRGSGCRLAPSHRTDDAGAAPLAAELSLAPFELWGAASDTAASTKRREALSKTAAGDLKFDWGPTVKLEAEKKSERCLEMYVG